MWGIDNGHLNACIYYISDDCFQLFKAQTSLLFLLLKNPWLTEKPANTNLIVFWIDQTWSCGQKSFEYDFSTYTKKNNQ